MTRGRIKIGVKSEAELNREFVEAWERAKRGEIGENDPRFLRRVEVARRSLKAGRGVRLEDIEELK
ncbi:MAG: hypothetical protein AABY65_05530 [Nitrospirota bacterium]